MNSQTADSNTDKCLIVNQELSMHADTTEMYIDAIMLSERSQTQRTACVTIPFIWSVQNKQNFGDRNWIPGCLNLGSCRGGEEWRYESMIGGYWVFFQVDAAV